MYLIHCYRIEESTITHNYLGILAVYKSGRENSDILPTGMFGHPTLCEYGEIGIRNRFKPDTTKGSTPFTRTRYTLALNLVSSLRPYEKD